MKATPKPLPPKPDTYAEGVRAGREEVIRIILAQYQNARAYAIVKKIRAEMPDAVAAAERGTR